MQKTQVEIDAMSPDELKAYKIAQENIVFGSDHKNDRKGKPIEQGIGSPGRENENHFAAIRKWEGPEAEQKAREAARAFRAKAKNEEKAGAD